MSETVELNNYWCIVIGCLSFGVSVPRLARVLIQEFRGIGDVLAFILYAATGGVGLALLAVTICLMVLERR